MSKETILNNINGLEEIDVPKSQKQPGILYILCLTELCERFGHYAMRGILVLYMTKVLLLSNDRSYGVFAGFSALLYLSPFFGGYLADKLIGFKWSVLLGGVLLTLGYVLLAIPGDTFFYNALALVVIGGGLFIPNMAGIIGDLYETKSALREGGYSIFYGAINLGALIPPIIITTVIMRYGWHSGFILAAIGVLIGTIIFYFTLLRFPNIAKSQELSIKQKRMFCFCIIMVVVLFVPGFSILIKHPSYANWVVCTIGSFLLLYAFNKSFYFNETQRNRLHVCFLLTLFTIIFEVLLQQIAMSMTIFVEYNVQRNVNAWNMPTVMFQALNPLFIILCAPLFSKLWAWLDVRKINPSIPTKLACGTLLMGLGFIIFPLALSQSSTGQISLIWIIVSYLMQSCGELLVSPVGLSMISEASPKSMIGTMMGVWYFATAIANSLAGMVSQWTTLSTKTVAPLLTAPAYSQIFGALGILSIITAIVIFCIVPKLKTILGAKPYENETVDFAASSLNIRSS